MLQRLQRKRGCFRCGECTWIRSSQIRRWLRWKGGGFTSSAVFEWSDGFESQAGDSACCRLGIGKCFSSEHSVQGGQGCHQEYLFGITHASPVELSLNGLSYRGKSELFITNSNQGFLGKISIQPDGTPKAKAEVLSRRVALVDNSAVGGKGGA